jgi:hypothetical protein
MFTVAGIGAFFVLVVLLLSPTIGGCGGGCGRCRTPRIVVAVM